MGKLHCPLGVGPLGNTPKKAVWVACEMVSVGFALKTAGRGVGFGDSDWEALGESERTGQ